MGGENVTADFWATVSQPGELRYQVSRPVPPQAPGPFTFLGRFEFESEQFRGATVVDIGCGPILHSSWFSGAELVALDPLANEYRVHVPWNRLDLAKEVYSCPAEELVPGLVGRADAVVSINALDHGYDFRLAVSNVAAYLRPGAIAFLSFDLHDQADDLHPLVLSREFCESAFADAGLCVERHSEGLKGNEDQPGQPGQPRRSYGSHGTAHHWWLRKELVS